MKNDKELIVFKLLAVGAALLYLYKLQKKNGGTLQGRYNPESIASLAAQLLPQEYRRQATQVGTAILDRMIQ